MDSNPGPKLISRTSTLQRRDPGETNIKITDVTLRAVIEKLSYASIKLQWDDKTMWCFHQPFGLKHECHDINGKKDKDFDFDFHMEHKNTKKEKPEFWVSRKPWNNGKEEVAFVDMGPVACGYYDPNALVNWKSDQVRGLCVSSSSSSSSSRTISLYLSSR